MEIYKNRNGQDRAFIRVSHTKVRVMGESKTPRKSADESGTITMFDFEGGPAYNIGSKIRFEKMEWKIKGIQQESVSSDKGELVSILLDISPIY